MEMGMNKRIIAYALTIFALLAWVSSNAATVGLTAITVNGDKMVNDSVLGVTWADVVPSSLVTFYAGPDNCCGIAYAGSAQQWIANLNSINYGSHNDWRLASLWPTLNKTYCTQNSIDEMGCLFNNELGASYGHEVTNFGPFTSLGTYQMYWSGTESYISPSARYARTFYTGFASRGTAPEGYNLGAMAVRTGLSEVAPVPVPASAWLFFSGLGGLGLLAKKSKKDYR